MAAPAKKSFEGLFQEIQDNKVTVKDGLDQIFNLLDKDNMPPAVLSEMDDLKETMRGMIRLDVNYTERMKQEEEAEANKPGPLMLVKEENIKKE